MALQLLWKNSVVVRRLACVPAITRHSKGFSSSKELEMKTRFEAWALEHGKSYSTLEEKERRFQIFCDKLRLIEKHNATFPRSCKKELTKFSDQTWDELQRTYCYTYIDENEL